MQPLTYRQWLQLKANDRSGQVPTDVTYSNMLLDIVGDDGRLDANAVGENRAITGNDGETYYVAGAQGDFAQAGKGLMDVNNTMLARYNAYTQNPALVAQYNQGASGGGGVRRPVDTDAAIKQQLRGEIKGRGADVDRIYNALFGDLDALVRARDAELETEYGGQLTKASDQYADALPQIETSYAAIGAADSTDTSDAKTGAKKGFEETASTIKKNKETDKSKLGQYSNEQRAKIAVDRDTASRNIARADETDDVGALRAMRNDLESNLGSAQVTRSTLGTDKGARGEVSRLTADNGRFEAAATALDSILKSSMSGAVKDAAVQAITTSAGLSDEEKKKIQQQYGNVYAEQAAL